jgi:WD40 repeat protein
MSHGADDHGSCIVWCTNTGTAVHFLPLHGDPIVSISFCSTAEWVVCASIDTIRCHWLVAPPVHDILSMWLNKAKPVKHCVELTKQLLEVYPTLPNSKV